jgi:hypothetical protein
MSEEILVNGIDALTGAYLPAPGTDRELVPRIPRFQQLSAFEKRLYAWLADPTRRRDPFRKPIEGVDQLRLDSAGWAVIFAPGAEGEIRDALQPLLKHRSSQTGPLLYREHLGFLRDQTMDTFLADRQAPPGNPDPKRFPYYVLLVGDPEEIPFRFQFELDVQYAVGRLWLEKPEDYASYANAVVAAETGAVQRDRRLTFFGVANADDRPTRRLCKDLIEPLALAFKDRKDWRVRAYLGADATREQLRSLLGGPDTPALLFTGSHGLGFRVPEEELESIRERQLAEQGALLCQDWPGPEAWKGAIPPKQVFAAADVPCAADLRGLLAFLFACYSGGTPERDGFADEPFGEPPRIASEPFVARLPQRLLARGALAAIAHMDRAWTTTFSWSEESQPALFVSILESLFKGEPLGWAMEYMNMHHADLSVRLSHLFQDQASLAPVNQERFSRLWRANNDARNFVVLGDPAVRFRA